MATGIGETLAAARRQQGVALADAAAETRVRESYLAALEEEDFAALGGDVYVKGFLRSYARFLRLDPEPLIATYRAHYERGDDTPLVQQPVAPLPSERSPGLIVGIGAVVIVVVLLAIVGLVSGRDDPAEEDLVGVPPPVTEPVTEPPVGPTPQPTEEQTDEPGDDPTEVLATDGVDITLELEGGPSWMRVTVDGQVEFEGEQAEGAEMSFSADDSIHLRLGDAGVVRVFVNGEDRGMLGARAEVVEQTFTADDAA
ncbi:MAG TPA: RodZ domain-containing protein [Egibacteraceae bacterium]|nr:RodZ domain-containing protein [Egibacteraceae bacterium]